MFVIITGVCRSMINLKTYNIYNVNFQNVQRVILHVGRRVFNNNYIARRIYVYIYIYEI